MIESSMKNHLIGLKSFFFLQKINTNTMNTNYIYIIYEKNLWNLKKNV